MTDEEIRVEDWDRRQCFGCSPDNPTGLHLDVRPGMDGTATAVFRPRAEHEGGPGMLHGGLAATALDEVMGWAAHETEDDAWVTATLELRYRQPVSVDGAELRLEAETVEKRGRRRRMRGRILDPAGTVAVEAEALFVRLRP